MEIIREMGFRKLYQQYVYIEYKDKLDVLAQYFAGGEEATGVLAFCYVDHEAGLTYEVLALAKRDGEALDFYAGNDDISIMLKVCNCSRGRGAAAAERIATIKGLCGQGRACGNWLCSQ